MRRATYGKGAKGKATRLHSKVVRSRGACEMCGESEYSKLQTAHIVPRRHAATRTDETAAWCLCARHHALLTENPDLHVNFAYQTLGEERYQELLKKARTPIKTSEGFWQAEVERLQALLAEVEAA